MRLKVLLHGPIETQRRWADQRAIQIAQYPTGDPLTALFVGDSSSGVNHETKADGTIVRAAAPEFDAVEVLDALVSVMGWCYQPQRRAMRDGQWLTVQSIREKHVWSQQVFERQARPPTVLATQNDKRRVGRRAGNGTTICW